MNCSKLLKNRRSHLVEVASSCVLSCSPSCHGTAILVLHMKTYGVLSYWSPDLLFSNQSHHMQNSSFVAPFHVEKRAESLDDLICTCDVLCVVGMGRRSLDTRLQNFRAELISPGTLRQNGADTNTSCDKFEGG